MNQESQSIMFTEQGHQIEIIQHLPQTGGYVGRYSNEDPDDDRENEPEYFPRLFLKPPTERLNAEVSKLQQDIAALKEQKKQIHASLKGEEAEVAAKRTSYAKYSQLSLLDDFIAGKLTHYIEDCWDRVIVRPIVTGRNETDKNGEFFDTDRDTFKLFSLFGRSNGDLQWNVNKYKDGSGNWTTVELCHSEEEAKEKARAMVQKEIDNAPKLHDNLISKAKSVGAKLPQEKVEAYLKENTESMERLIKERQKDIAKYEAKMNLTAEQVIKP